MRYGSEEKYDEETSLGKFGLGLKTASLSQCQKLSVVSRSNKNKREIHGYCWDLDQVKATNKWEVIRLDKKSLQYIAESKLADLRGTVIFWQKLDRMLGYKHPYGEKAKIRLATMCRELETQLAMVFHRYLANEVRNKQIEILLNDQKINHGIHFLVMKRRQFVLAQRVSLLNMRVSQEMLF